MNGRFSTYVKSGWIDEMAAKTKYLALMTSNPYLVSDPLTVEVSGMVYNRELSTWARTSPTLLTLNAELIWYNLDPGTVIACVAGFDAQYNGHLLFADMLAAPVTLASGGLYTLPSDQMALGIDV